MVSCCHLTNIVDFTLDSNSNAQQSEDTFNISVLSSSDFREEEPSFMEADFNTEVFEF